MRFSIIILVLGGLLPHALCMKFSRPTKQVTVAAMKPAVPSEGHSDLEAFRTKLKTGKRLTRTELVAYKQIMDGLKRERKAAQESGENVLPTGGMSGTEVQKAKVVMRVEKALRSMDATDLTYTQRSLLPPPS